MTTQAQMEAIRKSVTVKAAVERAFQAFTDEITTWWPLATHSYGGEKATTAVFEGRNGGRVYEHRGWERAGENAAAMRERYDGRWEVVLSAFSSKAG